MKALTATYNLPLWQKMSTKVLFFIFAGILVSMFILYAYLVNKTIMNVVAREKIQKNISSLSTTIGGMEANYLTLENKITMDLAYQKGFQDANPAFVTLNRSIAYNSTH